MPTLNTHSFWFSERSLAATWALFFALMAVACGIGMLFPNMKVVMDALPLMVGVLAILFALAVLIHYTSMGYGSTWKPIVLVLLGAATLLVSTTIGADLRGNWMWIMACAALIHALMLWSSLSHRPMPASEEVNQTASNDLP